MTNITNIIVAGRGKFADSLVKNTRKLANSKINILRWHEFSNSENTREKSLVIHAGSGRELEDIIEFCEKSQSVLVQATTGLFPKDYLSSASKLDFVLIDAPNISLPIVKFMRLLEMAGELFDEKDFSVKFSESHQSSKKTLAGTAAQMAESLGLNKKNILSIRDKNKQRELGIEEKHLDGHAVHWIEIEGLGGKISFKTEIMGRDAYAHGVMAIYNNIEKIEKLEKSEKNKSKVYSITDLVKLKLI